MLEVDDDISAVTMMFRLSQSIRKKPVKPRVLRREKSTGMAGLLISLLQYACSHDAFSK